MKQVSCPDCTAPMWEGGRCPWDRGSGCVARSLPAFKAKAATQTNERLKERSVALPRVVVARKRVVRVARPGERLHVATGLKSHEVEWENRITCKGRRHDKPPYGTRCLPCKREALRARRARAKASAA